MQKTNASVTIPILPVVREYLEKLLNGEARKISEQKLNEYNKVICKLAGINDSITFTTYSPIKKEKVVPKYTLITNHCFRRSFGTISLSLGIQPSIILKITGHQTLSSFEHYIGFTTQNAVDEVSKALRNVKI